jgi:ABC-type transporter Mla MlaB component
VDWNKPAASIRVNVSGVKRLTLRVDSAGGALWLHGSSAWADARVER